MRCVNRLPAKTRHSSAESACFAAADGPRHFFGADALRELLISCAWVEGQDIRVKIRESAGADGDPNAQLHMNESGDRNASEYLLRVVDHVPAMLAYWDKDLLCRFANQAYQRWFGKDPATLLGTSIRDLLGPELFALNEPYINGALRGEEQTFERIVPGPDGTQRHSLASYIPDKVDGAVVGFLVQVTEVTKLKEAESELLRRTAILHSVTEAIPARVAVLGGDHRYRLANGAFERRWDVPRESLIGRTPEEVMGPVEFGRRSPYLQRASAGEVISFELDYPASEGTKYESISYIPVRLDTGEIDGLVTVAQDITLQKREELRLKEMALRDPLTGLLNRTGFENYLERALREGAGAKLALLYIDLDYFKPVNDKHGHSVGDEVLRLFAQRLVHLVRATDAVARLGGDEFAIALAGMGERADASAMAEKVLAAEQSPFRVGSLRLNVGASVGVAFGADAAKGWQDLIERADAQLLAAKAARSCCEPGLPRGK